MSHNSEIILASKIYPELGVIVVVLADGRKLTRQYTPEPQPQTVIVGNHEITPGKKKEK